MTAPQFLEHARKLDADIMALDRRYTIARLNHAPRQAILRLEAQRNELVREWGKVWHTKRVSP